MAIVKGPIQFSGSISNVSFYTRRGSDKVIARSKGGATKEKIKSSANFEGFRLQQNEWKGCTAFASSLRYTFGGLYRLADYNLTPVLNGLAKNLQKTDTENPNGQRSICLSHLRYTLDNFNFNRQYPFNTVFRLMVSSAIDRSEASGTVHIPRIIALNDILNIQKLPYFRLIVSLGVMSDVKWDAAASEFRAATPDIHGISEVWTGEWCHTESVTDEQTIKLQLTDNDRAHFDDNASLILSMGIEFGKPGFTGETLPVKYAGCGRVLRVG